MKAKYNLGYLLYLNETNVSKVSEATGVSRPTLARWKKEQMSVIEVDKVARVCEFLGCRIEDFITYEKEEQK